jgi:hypothetical protein
VLEWSKHSNLSRELSAPELYEGLRFFFEAFQTLCTSRTIGMEPNPISFGDMITYCQLYGLDGEETEDFIYFIGAMDSVWLKHHADTVRRNRQSKSRARGKKV